MDYEELLKKYIQYIHDVEGVNYINDLDRRYESDVSFSNEEWRELEKLSSPKTIKENE